VMAPRNMPCQDRRSTLFTQSGEGDHRSRCGPASLRDRVLIRLERQAADHLVASNGHGTQLGSRNRRGAGRFCASTSNSV
jgi:hypothetical protein